MEKLAKVPINTKSINHWVTTIETSNLAKNEYPFCQGKQMFFLISDSLNPLVHSNRGDSSWKHTGYEEHRFAPSSEISFSLFQFQLQFSANPWFDSELYEQSEKAIPSIHSCIHLGLLISAISYISVSSLEREKMYLPCNFSGHLCHKWNIMWIFL